MALENIQTGSDIPADKPVMMGPRGGMKYDSALHSKVNMESATNNIEADFKPPTYIIVGPGVDMAFFRVDGGFSVKHKGLYCGEAIELAKTLASADYSFKEIIDELCKEFNCHIVDENEGN